MFILRKIVFLFLLAFFFWQTRAEAQQPPFRLLDSCVVQFNEQNLNVESVSAVGAYRDASRIYYNLTVFPTQEDRSWDAVVFAEDSAPEACQIFAPNPMGDPVPSTAFLPLPIAKGLTLDTLRNTIEKFGGLMQFQNALIEQGQQDGYLVLMPYEQEALQEIGVQIPDSIEVISPQ